MKVVIFCGGFGLRMREQSPNVPKPLARIGYRPILWHVMSYYAHFGHTDFVLCLGYQADAIKEYFLNYQEALSNDFVLSKGGREITLLNRDIDRWTITFVDTGLHAKIGQRLRQIEPHIGGDEVFLASYADGLTDLPLDAYLEHFHARDCVASFLSVRPSWSFHLVETGPDDRVKDIRSLQESTVRINGGFFAFRRAIFDHIRDDEDLVEEPFRRLIRADQLLAYPYDGFWQCLDTFKDKEVLEDMLARGEAPWVLWNGPRSGS